MPSRYHKHAHTSLQVDSIKKPVLFIPFHHPLHQKTEPTIAKIASNAKIKPCNCGQAYLDRQRCQEPCPATIPAVGSSPTWPWDIPATSLLRGCTRTFELLPDFERSCEGRFQLAFGLRQLSHHDRRLLLNFHL